MKHCLTALAEIDSALEGARRVLISSDFDGTLCPIAETPQEVRVAPAMLEVLRHLTASPRITVAVVSGRALANLKSRLPLNTVMAGNHGLEIAGGGLRFVHRAALAFRPELTAAGAELAQALGAWPGAWVEDKRLSLTVHYRCVDRRCHRSLLMAARRAVVPFAPRFALRADKLALEVRPKIPWDKGCALAYIQQHMGPFDATIYLGDSRGDEPAFRANRGGLNIRVGRPQSACAPYYLSDPSEVAVLFAHLLGLFRPGATAREARHQSAGTSFVYSGG